MLQEMAVKLSHVLIVLDKVRHPDNLGAALRAMKNSGLDRIALSDPATRDFERAKVLAAGADDLLAGLAVAPDLASAVAKATLVAGTSPRSLERRPSIELRDFIALASAETERGGEVAIVFGNEQRGLSDDELDHCHQVVAIPTARAKSSINLAQAVMLVAHECFMASRSSAKQEGAEMAMHPPVAPRATAGALEALYARTRALLLEVDFLNAQNPDAILSELKRLLERAQPTQREVELLLSAAKHLERAARARR